MSILENNSANFMPLAKSIAVDMRSLKQTVDALGMANSIAEAVLHMELLQLQLEVVARSIKLRMQPLLPALSSTPDDYEKMR